MLSSVYEYELCLKHGINPLFWHRHIKLVPTLRIQLQNKIFGKSELGKGNVVQANDKYYHYCWDHGLMVCEECGRPLYAMRHYDCYSATYISHILTRGSNPNMAHDPRNHNILCKKHHDQWETGERRGMIIYPDNQVVIRELKKDYYL